MRLVTTLRFLFILATPSLVQVRMAEQQTEGLQRLFSQTVESFAIPAYTEFGRSLQEPAGIPPRFHDRPVQYTSSGPQLSPREASSTIAPPLQDGSFSASSAGWVAAYRYAQKHASDFCFTLTAAKVGSDESVVTSELRCQNKVCHIQGRDPIHELILRIPARLSIQSTHLSPSRPWIPSGHRDMRYS